MRGLQWIENTTAWWDGYLEFQRRPPAHARLVCAIHVSCKFRTDNASGSCPWGSERALAHCLFLASDEEIDVSFHAAPTADPEATYVGRRPGLEREPTATPGGPRMRTLLTFLDQSDAWAAPPGWRQEAECGRPRRSRRLMMNVKKARATGVAHESYESQRD